MEKEQAVVAIQNVSFTYPGREYPVLDAMNFSLGKGKVGLIGPNGSGKTTFFHIIMGLLTPGEGKVLFKGSIVQGEKGFQDLRKSVGLLFQDADDQLFSPTVLEDVAFGPLNLGASPEEARKTAQETLKNLGLRDLEMRVTHRLSGGEKKLVSLATILSMQPELLLLDEPTNNLDQETRLRLIDILNGLDLSYAIISHDWDFLEKTTREVYVIEKGRITQCEKASLHEHHHAHVYGDHPHHHGD
ncbi:MAG: ABC transporter ATP-binding protein [Desulfobulbaceae bacterium]|uniref:ABC transporter ATP-binding protein n=1 Tax=Candidatus Desulfobia pelagia TaxID=2841692 RepID=A0A8J6NE02_9BACT|nr:ABC transporter ATP-binding protein [Candidatus Desulfobia pelagia]